MSTPKNPPVIHAKLGLKDLSSDEKLALSDTIVASMPHCSIAALLQQEFQELTTSANDLRAKKTRHKQLQDAADAFFPQVTAADHVHDTKVTNFGRKAAQESKGDVTVLESCGLTAAAVPGVRKPQTGLVEVGPIKLAEGAKSGQMVVKRRRNKGAGSIVIQYKLDSSAPTDPWLPPDGIQTSKLAWTIENLPPGQLIRVRVRAIGDVPGPWVEEVGRAR